MQAQERRGSEVGRLPRDDSRYKVRMRSGTGVPMKARAGSASIAWLLCFCLTVPAMAQSTAQTPAVTTPSAATDSTTNPNPSADSTSSSSSDSTAAANPSTPPGVKPGSKNDVDAIGTRKVGGRGLGDWYSTDTEIKMGKQYAMMVEQTAKMVQDPVINEYVNRIGQNLVRNSDAKVPFTIKVIDSDEINAFALPGGFFYVNSGLILAADEEAELAGVMAHEIAHVAARHAMQQMTRMQYASLATIPLMFVGSWGIYRSGEPGHQPGAAHHVPEVLAQLRERSRLSWTPVHVQSGLRSAGVCVVLREDRSEGQAEAGNAGAGICVASADSGPDRKGAGRD